MTFSIAGFCARTGEFGCALATSSMTSGARAPFVAPGHGVVLTQARSDPTLGPLGLARLAAGRSAEETLGDLVAATPHAAWRQLAVLDRAGRRAHFTGAKCVDAKGGDVRGDGVAIGNALANDRVVGAILTGFAAAPQEPLATRLVMALEHGLAAGGEAYPLRSAALKLARPGVPFLPIDLRVDLDEAPIAALRRLWQMWAPMVDGYIARAMDPDHAPSAAAIEGHLPAG